MGRRSRQRGAARWAAVHARAGRAPGGESEEDGPGSPPSPGSASYYQDPVDGFHEARAQAALARGWAGADSGDEAEDEEQEEEVLALDVDDDDEEDASDPGEASAGDDDDDDDDGGSSVRSEASAPADPSLSWGQRKKLYYDTDYGSKPRGRRSQPGEEEEEEREEEEEARAIQRRLAQALREDDFGVAWVEAFAKPAPRADDEPETRVAKDLAKVSAKEKLRLLRKESPELLELMADLQAKLTEAKDELEPLLVLAERGVLPPGRGSRYLRTKYHLYLNYCSNISFYLILKARRIPADGHPVIDRLVTYRRLINRLSAVDQKLSPEIRRLLTGEGGARKKEPKRKAKLPAARSERTVGAPDASDDSDADEAALLQYYREMEDGPKVKRKKEEESGRGEPAPEEQNAKRAITYQIAKNRGLTPRRKKIDRNPRVKHREKFRRAKIRRRGQVREVRKEEQRYSGELSGIRAGVKKSVKLK